jgi:hypothetical protein
MVLLVALLSVSFLLTYTPSARAAGSRADLPGFVPGSEGGPDDPDDGTGTHGSPTTSTARPHAPRIGVSVPIAPTTTTGIQGTVRGRSIQQDRVTQRWFMMVRTLVQALWQVR